MPRHGLTVWVNISGVREDHGVFLETTIGESRFVGMLEPPLKEYAHGCFAPAWLTFSNGEQI
jgi:hypothetical protein